MARSGSVDYSVTANNVITDAHHLLRVLPPGATLGTDQSTYGLRVLNLLVKRLQNQGLYLHVITEGTLFLVDSQESYSLGTGGDHASASYVKTELLTAADNTDTEISVDAITGISNADVIGVELDDGSLHWTTVNGVPAGNEITLTAGITDDAAADNHVYTYTTIIERPQRILRGTVRIENSEGSESPVRLVSRDEYFRLPNKSSQGTCNQVYYDQQYGATGTLYTWPTCNDVKQVIHFGFERLLQDLDLTTHDLDFPIGAHQMLIYSLAVDLAPAYPNIDPQHFAFLMGRRDELVDDYMSRDSEEGSIFIQPNLR